ncbi:hypothetical protein [Argonema galeatum]|uniref:hypothetical protein n=1 Tax=Argonema galeatum TaxID=2942762 RepID=UPI002012E19F|nr:hypothetical protein [Argonema galeatum]MCL1464981.1 hypothetical protein [Argonema galeatum A003/A1]
MRNPRIWIVGLFSIAALGSAYLPVKAQQAAQSGCPTPNDAATIQKQRTNIVLTGDSNGVDVGNTQTNVNQASKPCGSNGVVQRQRNNVDIEGKGNQVRSNQRQTNVDQSDTNAAPAGRRRVNLGN